MLKTIKHASILGVLAAFLSTSLFLPMAQAGVISTEDFLSHHDPLMTRDALKSRVDSEALAERLAALGVDPILVKDRIDRLTDDELARLSKDLDRLPAGGDAFGTVVFVFLVLLVTDILGYTDIFPFVKKTAR